MPLRAHRDPQLLHRHASPEWSNVWIAGGGSAEGFKFGPMVGEYVAKRVMGIEGDPAIAKAFRIPKEEFEEPPRTAADSPACEPGRTSIRAKARADLIKADSAKGVVPSQGAAGFETRHRGEEAIAST